MVQNKTPPIQKEMGGNENPSPTMVQVSAIDPMMMTIMPPLEVHTVCLPPQKTTFQKFKQRISDVFFPNGPLRGFKDQTVYKKLVLSVECLFPITRWGREYSFELFKSDLVSGLTVASLSIPHGISIAKLANLPPIIGLYSSFVPPLVYSVLGSSRHLAVGPVAVSSLVMGTMLNEAVSYVDQPTLYLQLAFTSTFFAGVFQASLGILRLGFIIDFLSKAKLIGFMAGAAVVVSLQQLKGLLGIVHFTNKMQLVPVLSSVFKNKDEWSCRTLVMGLSFLAFLLTAREISMRKPKYFLLSAASPLIAVILSTLLVFTFKSKFHGVPIIGHLPKGVNPPSANLLYFTGSYIGVAIKTGLVTGILSLTEGIAVGRTYSALNNYQIDGNKEMMAIGFMNMIGSCSYCFLTTGSFVRSALNYNAGAKTAVSNIVLAATVLLTLLFLTPLFHYTPNFVLAAIIITAVIGLINYEGAFKLWKVDKLDFLACFCSFFGVIFISVPMGIAIAVGVLVFKILLHVTRPNTVLLGNIVGTDIYQSLKRYKEATRVPAFLILALEAPIYFANATYIQERILRYAREEEERIKEENGHTLKYIILDMTAVTAIDTSGIDAICELKRVLKKRELQLVLTNPVGSVMEKLDKSNMLDMFKTSGLYLTVGEAIADISSLGKSDA